jgi:hypothetical protein
MNWTLSPLPGLQIIVNAVCKSLRRHYDRTFVLRVAETWIPMHSSKPPALDIAVDTSRPLTVVDPNGRSQRRFTDRKSLHTPVLIRGVLNDAEVETMPSAFA